MATILPVPPTLKPCQTYLKLATDHEKINPTLTYWARLYALQMGLKIDSKAKENRDFLMSVMDWLEKEKKTKEADEKISSEVVAQAHVENYGMKIFLKADEDDRAGNTTKNTAKQFFTAAQIFDLNAVFGEVSDELLQKSKYSKWRAAYIIKCIKNGEVPQPPEDEKLNDEINIELPPTGSQPATSFNDGSDMNEQINNLAKWSLSNDDKNRPPSTTSNFSNATNYIPTPSVDHSCSKPGDTGSPVALNGTKLSRDDILKAQKYSKWASSSMDYDDIRAAANNLQKALNILTKGRED